MDLRRIFNRLQTEQVVVTNPYGTVRFRTRNEELIVYASVGENVTEQDEFIFQVNFRMVLDAMVDLQIIDYYTENLQMVCMEIRDAFTLEDREVRVNALDYFNMKDDDNQREILAKALSSAGELFYDYPIHTDFVSQGQIQKMHPFERRLYFQDAKKVLEQIRNEYEIEIEQAKRDRLVA